jgi:cytoskeletal protein CcmA (bactofilin family)
MFGRSDKKIDTTIDIPSRDIKKTNDNNEKVSIQDIDTKETIKTDEVKSSIENKNSVDTSDKKITNQHSIISQGMQIKGEINGTTDIDIYGSFDGTIKLENNNVNIESSAKIKADINAKTIRVNGEITGNLTAIDKILVTNKGIVNGSLSAEKVEIQDGAQCDGNITMKKSNSIKVIK